jgi:hypothetical protein
MVRPRNLVDVSGGLLMLFSPSIITALQYISSMKKAILATVTLLIEEIRSWYVLNES